MIRAEDIVERVEKITPVSGTLARLLEVVENPDSSVSDVVEVIQYDPAITGELLKLCNSAAFGLARKVHSVHEAVCYLGTRKVMQLVVAIYGNAVLSGEQRGYGLEPGILWKHSVAVALAASHLAHQTMPEEGGVAFTAGLLHDIGKVVLNEYVGREFAEIVRRVSEQGLSFAEAESQVLGFSHAEIGARLAERWSLPEPLVRAIRWHHEPQALDPPDVLVDTVYLADSVCMMLGIGLGTDGLNYRADAEVLHRRGLRLGQLEICAANLIGELKDVEYLFSIGAATSAGNDRAAASR